MRGFEMVDMDSLTERVEEMSLTIAERVANGARWLDENFPDWESRINVDTLQLTSAYDCICGQVFSRTKMGSKRSTAGYEWAVDHLFAQANSWIPIPKGDPDRKYTVAYYLGFWTSTESYVGLQSEWTGLLKERSESRAEK